MTYAGQSFDMPYTYTYTYDGNTYSSTLSAALKVDDDLEGTFISRQVYTYNGQSTPYSYTYDLSAEKTAKRTYEISVPDDELDLTCALDKDELDCDVDGEDGSLFFERDE